MATPAPATFTQLLEDAVNEPGTISTAYTAFWNYSLGNQLLAFGQCRARGIQPGPIATFQRWKELGRWVRKGERALVLCQPLTIKRANSADGEEEDEHCATIFTYKARWFTIQQTDGASVPDASERCWDKERALGVLEVEEIPFDELNGNCLGFARGRSIAINPVNPLPWKTRFHELGHVLLGHTSEGVDLNDGELTPRNLRECEAEAVALLCCAALQLPGVECARGYIQAWWGSGNAIPDRSCQRILKVADAILKAGREQEEGQ